MSKRQALLDSLAVWLTLEVAAMTTGAWVLRELYFIVDGQSIGRSLTPATVLLSVVVAIAIQLWVKLNELSTLKALSASERKNLSEQVRLRVRGLVWLIVFFVAFIFALLVCAALASSKWEYVESALSGIGAGCGACVPLLAAVLVDLNEISEFRWEVDRSDEALRKKDKVIAELNQPSSNFNNDQHLKGYSRVIGE